MNKFNKGKLVGIVAASLSAVSLMGVGFATWVIGSRKTDTQGDVTITADSVQYKSLTVSVKFLDGITLAETGETTNSDNSFNFINDKVGDLTAEAEFTITVGKDYQDSDWKFNQISLNFVDAKANDITYVDNKVAENDVHLTGKAKTGLTYIDVPTTIDISKAKLGIPETATDGSMTKSVKFKETITFTWRSMFGAGNVSPMNYYNTEIAKSSVTDKDLFMVEAFNELDAMHTKYGEGTNVKLQMQLGNKA